MDPSARFPPLRLDDTQPFLLADRSELDRESLAMLEALQYRRWPTRATCWLAQIVLILARC
jgi:hypothetical protein